MLLKTAVFKYVVGEREIFWESKVGLKPVPVAARSKA